jgi:hypothetical protein
MEANLARFYRRFLSPSLGGSHLPLLTGFEAPTDPPRHAVASLDWWFEPRPAQRSATRRAADHTALVETRHAAEGSGVRSPRNRIPRRLRAFRSLLDRCAAPRADPEEQVSELTLAWPVMRRAVLRIGEAFATSGRDQGAR